MIIIQGSQHKGKSGKNISFWKVGEFQYFFVESRGNLGNSNRADRCTENPDHFNEHDMPEHGIGLLMTCSNCINETAIKFLYFLI